MKRYFQRATTDDNRLTKSLHIAI